jgi:hypothetical protein
MLGHEALRYMPLVARCLRPVPIRSPTPQLRPPVRPPAPGPRQPLLRFNCSRSLNIGYFFILFRGTVTKTWAVYPAGSLPCGGAAAAPLSQCGPGRDTGHWHTATPSRNAGARRDRVVGGRESPSGVAEARVTGEPKYSLKLPSWPNEDNAARQLRSLRAHQMRRERSRRWRAQRKQDVYSSAAVARRCLSLAALVVHRKLPSSNPRLPTQGMK